MKPKYGCTVCGSVFDKRRKYCDSCHMLLFKITNISGHDEPGKNKLTFEERSVRE
jgi:rRNA maturation endonuclease Nob1